MKTAIIGIGSPFGDDQAGWQAVDVMTQEDWVQKRQRAGSLAVMKLDRPGLCLLETMRDFEYVILIDAVLSPKHSPGMLLPLKREELETMTASFSSHGIGVAEVLALGDILGELPRRLEIWGVVISQDACLV